MFNAFVGKVNGFYTLFSFIDNSNNININIKICIEAYLIYSYLSRKLIRYMKEELDS